VVVEDEVQGVAGLGEPAGEVEVFPARRRVAARVGVEGDDAGRAAEERRPHDLAGLGGDVTDSSKLDLRGREDLRPSVAGGT